MPSVLLFGAGSIGSVYLYILDQAKASVTAVCRSNYDTVKANGFTINSEKFGQNLKAKPNVVRSVSDAKGPFDFLIVSSKVFSGTSPSTPSLIAPAVSSNTTIVLVQNGIGIEDEYQRAFPNNPLISCVVYLPAVQVGPGHIEMGDLERLEIGMYPSTAPQEPAQSFATLLKSGGSNTIVFSDVQEKRWSKLIVNAGWNPTCALGLCSDVEFMGASEGATEYIFQVMLEVVAIAQALGYEKINEAEATMQLNRAKARIGSKGIQPSMLADVKMGRALEVEAILGNTIKIGREKGVSIARLESLYYLTKALDASLARRRNAAAAEAP
jgi:2-dehydropantoate 2-reductase